MESKKHYFRWKRSLLFVISNAVALFGHTMAQVKPKPDVKFQEKTNITAGNSAPAWPAQVTARKNAPNIVIVLLDDVGFSATSTFGGPTPVPTLDSLAAHGLRYNRFHVTPMCAPSRAALLSGRNSHQMGFGRIPELAAGYPGYNSLWPKTSASVAEVLKHNGYSTAAFGKWHNTPVWEVNPSGPFERWPTGLGFEYFYGFIGFGTSQWEPNLIRNQTPVSPPSSPKDGYHLTEDLANDAIGWVQQHNSLVPDKPFFLYFAAGATHSPFQVPKQWVDKFKGKFDQGWDKIREESFHRQKAFGIIPANTEFIARPEEIAPWESLNADQKQLMARQMEVYAAFLAHTDYEIGRLLRTIRSTKQGENTIVIFIADDNGPTSEGGVDGRDALSVEARPEHLEERLSRYDSLGSVLFDNAPAAAWAWASNSPFKGAKSVAAHLGGTRAPVVISWPNHIGKPGGVRSQVLHLIDVAPTLYEIAGIQTPKSVNGIEQTRLAGKSFAYTFNNPEDLNKDRVQYFEIFGSRGIYKNGWWAGSPNGSPWKQGNSPAPVPLGQRPWELYNLDQDYSQAKDLSVEYPQKVEEMKLLFDTEARRNNVYPLEPPLFGSMPSVTTNRTHFVYHEGIQRIPFASAPQVAGRAHKITTEVSTRETSAEGIIVAQGGRQGGYTLYIKDGRVVYETSSYGHLGGRVVSSEVFAPGKTKIEVEIRPDESAPASPPGFRRSFKMKGKLIINGKLEGEVNLIMAPAADSLDIGGDLVSPVSSRYSCPFTFTGTIDHVTIDLL